MSWKKHFVVYQNKSPITGNTNSKNRGEGYTSRFQSWLPEVYTGMPNRTERYMQYDQMDMDSEINMALDTIAEFSTQIDVETSSPFKIRYKDDPTESEAKIIKQALKQWCSINDWDRRIFRTFRNVIKYGDQPFIRDPETWEMLFVQPQDVIGVVINESKGKEPEQYIVKNLDLNLQTKTATTPIGINRTTGGITNSTFTTLTGRQSGVNTGYSSANISNSVDEFHVSSDNVVHVAMTEGMDPNFPFGSSILDPIFKTYKQKELLEDSIIIYRVQRAPERRVFYIDVGDMPAHRASAFLEKVKMEVHQKRIPNKTGGGNNIMDAQYNPLCLALDTKIPLLDGRTLELNELINEYQDGKENWAYSCDPETGKIVPGVITWAGITRKDTQVIKLTFDNGKSLTVTPDHKIPVFGKGFVEAKDLTPSDSLISFETRQQKLPSSKNKTTYTQVYDHNDKEWTFVHRMVGEYFRKLGKHQEFTYIIEGNKNIVHHKDFNRYNNDPKNLQWMNKEDHFKFHGDSNFWANVSPAEAVEVKEKIRTTLVERWKSLSNEDRIVALDNIIKAQKKAVNLRNTDSYVKEKYSKTMRAVRLKFLEKNPEFVKYVLLPNLNSYTKNYPNQNKVYSFRMIQIISETVKKHNSNKKQTIELLSNNEEFLEEIRKNNPRDPSKNYKILNDKVTVESFERTLFHFGYKGWKDFVSKLEVFNHRITNIEYINEKQDTGTITIDGKEKWHNYHTFATESGIFVKNSIMEDFFFAQGCLVLDTKLPLLDGRTLTLEEVIKEHQEGKENWVYGLSNVTHELEPAKIKWAGITRRDAKVLEVRVDNGESVIATPDHKFILRDGTEVEAQNLKSGDSLMPLNLELGYTGIPKYSNKVPVSQNHKVLEVIELDYTIDTGDITIESESGSHWFGLGAGIYVHNSDGRGSKVEVLPGGDNLGEISDLKFFTDKMMRGLRIPSSYMPLSSDDSGAVYTDGRVGTAFIQEFRFNKYCQRLQNIIQPVFDREFKRFLKHRGFNIDASMFDLIFTEPQSFSQYRQIELDSAKAGVFGQLEGSRYLSRRFLLKKYLGLSPAEILENEQLYLEENPKGKVKASDLGNQMGLGDVGIRGSEFENIDNIDMEAPSEEELGGGNPATEPAASPLGGGSTQGEEGQ